MSNSFGTHEKQNNKMEMEICVSLILNRLFNKKQTLIDNLDDINNFLIQLIDLVKTANFNNRSSLLSNALFSMIYNLGKAKLHSNESKYLDLCILSDLADSLINNLGKLNQTNAVNIFITL